MLVLVGFALVAGLLTILSACVLPIAPVVLSDGVSDGKARPFGVVTGFVVSFVVATLSLSAVVRATGIPPEIPRCASAVILVAFGTIMIVPALHNRFEFRVSGFVSRSNTFRTATNESRRVPQTPRGGSCSREHGTGRRERIATLPKKRL
jgi:cytochrome c biogenesis protein CcdA